MCHVPVIVPSCKKKGSACTVRYNTISLLVIMLSIQYCTHEQYNKAIPKAQPNQDKQLLLNKRSFCIVQRHT